MLNNHHIIPSSVDLLQSFADFIHLDVANGAASTDTIQTYYTSIKIFFTYAKERNLDIVGATANDVKLYRRYLIEEKEYAASTVRLKLVTLRRFYQSLITHGLRDNNPTDGISAPTEAVDKAASIKYLDSPQLKLLLDTAKSVRDRLILHLMSLHGCRVVELQKAKLRDVETQGDGQ